MERKAISRRNFLISVGAFAGSKTFFEIFPYSNGEDNPKPKATETVKPTMPFSKEDLIAVGFGGLAADKILKATPALIRAGDNIAYCNREETGNDDTIPWQVMLALLGMENSFDIESRKVNGPYQLVKKQYHPIITQEQFLQATYDAAEFLATLGNQIGINPEVENGDPSKLPLKHWGGLAANYNGLTEPVRVSGRNVYGNPETGKKDWMLSGYVLNNYNAAARNLGYPIFKSSDGIPIDTNHMPVRITYPYPVPLPPDQANKYFAPLKSDGFLTITIRLIESEKIAQEREEKITGDNGAKIVK